jgi:hypothetical protein
MEAPFKAAIARQAEHQVDGAASSNRRGDQGRTLAAQVLSNASGRLRIARPTDVVSCMMQRWFDV